MTEPATAGPAVTATLTSSGSLTAFKVGDVLTYTLAVTGDTATIAPSPIVVGGVSFNPVGGPWQFIEAETFSPPTVTGLTLTKPFTVSSTDPHVYTATI